MPMPAYNYLNKTVGDLKIVARLGKDSNGSILWDCLCKCGKLKTISARYLKAGTKSCGKCQWDLKHKDAYNTWKAMRTRCEQPTHISYHNYGGKGITVCNRWQHFPNFLDDMGDPGIDLYGNRKTLDRIDSSGNYEHANCRWASAQQQAISREV